MQMWRRNQTARSDGSTLFGRGLIGLGRASHQVQHLHSGAGEAFAILHTVAELLLRVHAPQLCDQDVRPVRTRGRLDNAQIETARCAEHDETSNQRGSVAERTFQLVDGRGLNLCTTFGTNLDDGVDDVFEDGVRLRLGDERHVGGIDGGHDFIHARRPPVGCDISTAYIADMDFDETLHPRNRNGTFTEKSQSDPEMTLGAGTEYDYHLRRLAYPGDSRPAIDWHIDPEEVAPNLAAFGDYVDMFTLSIDEGHLSRGVAGAKRADAARAWVTDASAAAQDTEDTELAEFRDGVRRGIVGLYYEKVEHEGALHSLAGPKLEDACRRALIFAEKKRASKPEREFWRMNLQHATAAEHRGMLVAAAALSGTDSWWGFRDRVHDVMTGTI